MKIKKIRLKKYKRFHDLTIDLGENPKRIIALIGPNGCGKSSVFDGISFLSNAYSMGYGKSTANVSDTYHKRYNDFNVSHEDVNIIFDNNYSYGQYQEKFKKENKGNTIVAFRSPYRYTSNLLIDKLQKVPEIKTNSNGAKFSLDLDDKMTNNFQLLYAKILNKVQECRMTYDQVINFYLDEINKSLAFCLNITIATLGNILDGHGTLFFKKTDQEELIDYNILSSGEKEVVDMLIDILVKKEDFSDSIFLIDEPELHLNTAIQRNLLREINRLIPENCQIWIATHSIGFLRALQEDFKDISQIIKFDGNYANEPVTLFPMERTRSNFLELYKTAVDDIAELIAPKTIIYCEGGISAKKDGFDAYCYNTIFEKEFPEVLFISSK